MKSYYSNQWTLLRNFLKNNIYLFIWLHHVLFAVGSIFNHFLWHVGSSSLTRDQTSNPCSGSSESEPLDHQGSPTINELLLTRNKLDFPKKSGLITLIRDTLQCNFQCFLTMYQLSLSYDLHICF